MDQDGKNALGRSGDGGLFLCSGQIPFSLLHSGFCHAGYGGTALFLSSAGEPQYLSDEASAQSVGTPPQVPYHSDCGRGNLPADRLCADALLLLVLHGRHAGAVPDARPVGEDLAAEDDLEVTMIELKKVSKRYKSGKIALNGVDLNLPRGEIVGLFGENGAGKTTLMKSILGLQKNGK